MREITKTRLYRLRASEIRFLTREAKRLQCAASEVVRAALARVAETPLTAEEIESARLPLGRRYDELQ